MNNQSITAQPTRHIRFVIFWAYVLLPLAWGVVNTLRQAMKLFG